MKLVNSANKTSSLRLAVTFHSLRPAFYPDRAEESNGSSEFYATYYDFVFSKRGNQNFDDGEAEPQLGYANT